MGNEPEKSNADAATDVKDESGKTKLLKSFKEYKEFIAILVFFIGGVVWLYAAFATKSYVDEFKDTIQKAITQIQESSKKSTANIKCVLGGSIEVYSKDTEIRFLQDEVTSNKIDLEKLKNQKLSIPEFIEQSEKIKGKIEDLERKIAAAQKIKTNQELKLKNEECSK